MIEVPVVYSAEVDTAVNAFNEARRLGMSRQLMKDLVDEICNDRPLLKTDR